MNQTEIPLEVVFEIFSFLPAKEFINYCSTNKTLMKFSSNEKIWKQRCEAQHQKKLENPTKQFSWKKYYKENYKFEKTSKNVVEIKLIEKMSLPKRKRHTAHFCNEKLFFIGGNVAGGCKNANVISEIDVKKNIKDCLLFPVLKLNNFPTKIERHVSVMYNNLIYIFSGILINNRKINNLWTFNPVLHEFNEVECIGDIPCNRCDSCATLENSNMWVFGGSNPDVQPMNDLYRFDIPKKKFELMEVKGDIPDKRSGPVLIYKHEKLFLFGGGQWMNGDWEKRFDDVHKYDIHTSTWSKIDCQSLNRSIETFKTIQIVGEYALLLCGVDEKVWVFNLVSLEWIETEVKAIQGDSQGSTLMNDKIVVHGGHYFSGQKDFYEVDLNFL